MQPSQKIARSQENRAASPSMGHATRRLPPPRQSGLGFLGILLCCPVAIIAVISFLFAGRALLETLLIASGLQILTFGFVIGMGLFRAKSPELPQPPATDADYVPPETAHVWRVYPGCSEAAKPFRIALISPDMMQSRNIATDLAGLGREVHHSTDRDAMLASVQARPEEWGLVIFDLDAAPDLETGVDELLDFRAVCSEMPVLLLSGSSPRNDLSSERRSIADATLRKPVFLRHLVDGMKAAHLNFVAGQ